MFFSTLSVPLSPSSLSLKEFDALFREMKSKRKKINFFVPHSPLSSYTSQARYKVGFSVSKLGAEVTLKINGICASNLFF